MENHYSPWTRDDVRDLKEMAQSGWSDAEISEEMGRTIYAVRAKRRALGILRCCHSKRVWTVEEMEELKALLVRFARKHDRSIFAVCKKGEEMGGVGLES